MLRAALRRRSERGATAVEAGLVTTFLFPLMSGVLWFGYEYWQMQNMPQLAERIDPSFIVGANFTCAQLTDLVEQSVLDNITSISDNNFPALGLDDITATVVDVLPTVGAVVSVRIVLEPDSGLVSLLPIDGSIVQETTFRLENVTLTTETCI
jgi:Flp pilus assembly protein TadG